MIETPQQFGPEAALFGILTQPGPEVAASPLGFVLFNAGVIPRLGPHRMNVKLARALAAEGHPVLRFDLSGHGDSPPAAALQDPQTQGARDLRAAMDHLAATAGVRRFALLGVCSGAVHAYHASLADARVAAVLMFDGFWYRSRWTRWVRDLKHFNAAPLGRAWRALVERVRLSLRRGAPPEDQSIFAESGNPPRDEFANGLQHLVERGAAVFVVYSGSVISYYSYGAQFRHVFGNEPWFSAVRCEYMPDIDHSFLELRSQRRFVGSVVGWLPAARRAALAALPAATSAASSAAPPAAAR